jgi:tetratricopeptide (TPR) repeat protein
MRKLLIITALITIALLIVSCATSPKKGGEPTAAKAQTEKSRTKEEKAKAKEEKSTANAEKGKTEGDYRTSAESLQGETETLISKAKGIKADVAMGDEYAKAKAAYDEALKDKNEGNYKKAAKSFEKARGLFEEVYAKTEEKRARAARSMEESQKALQLVEEKAKAAGVN